MVAEVFAGIASLKAALDIAKALKDIDDVTRRNLAVIELSEKIIAAQVAQNALVETTSELRKRLAEFETWDVDKRRYELREISDGTFAYVVKESSQGTEPKHAICPKCFESRQKSILQAMVAHIYGGQATCPVCQLVLSFNENDARSPFTFKNSTHFDRA